MGFDVLRQEKPELNNYSDNEIASVIKEMKPELSAYQAEEISAVVSELDNDALYKNFGIVKQGEAVGIGPAINEGIDKAQERMVEIPANAQKAAGTLAETFIDQPAEALANITGINPGIWYDDENGLQASWNMPADKQTSIGGKLKESAEEAKKIDTGYQPLGTLEAFENDPSVSGFFSMMAENGLSVTADMVASVFGLPAYAASELQRLGDERAKNKGKDEADWIDIYEASPGAIMNVAGDRLLANTVLGRVGKAIKTTKADTVSDKAIKVAKAVAAGGAMGAANEGAQEGVEYASTNLGTQAGFKDDDFWKSVRAGAYIGGGIGAGGRSVTATIEAQKPQNQIESELNAELKQAEEALQAELESLNELKQKADNGDALDAAEYEAKKAGFDANLEATNKDLQAKAQAILEQNTFNGDNNLLEGINQSTGVDRQNKAQADKYRLNDIDAGIQQANEELANAEREVFADQFGLPSPESMPDPVLFGDDKGSLSTTQARDVPAKPIGVQSNKQPVAGKRYEDAINNQFNIKAVNGKGEQIAPTDEQIKTAAKKEEEGKVLSVTQKNIVDNLNAENIDRQDVLATEQNDVATKTKGLEVVELPVDQLRLSDDVPNFKSNANKEGVVEPLGGKFDRTGVAPIHVWQRNNGNVEVISGRHRLDLAKRSGEKTIPVQVHKESEGFGKDQAIMLDTILNIRDGQGEVIDYVDAFRNGIITKETADSEGILARAKGKWAYGLANGGSEELIAGVRNGKIGAQSAHKVAQALPGNDRAQQLVLSKILNEDMSVNKALNIGLAISAMQNQQADTTGDMFGYDDSMMQEAEQISKIVTKKQKTIQEDIAAVKGAAKNPKTAKKYGVNVKNPSAVKAKIQDLEQQKNDWEKWTTNQDLVAEVRNEMASDGNNSPILSQYTQEDLDAREQAQADAQAQEQEAIDREAAQKTSDMFGLTGSDSYLDEAAAQGQTDMLGELKDAETQPTTEATQEAAPEAQKQPGLVKLAKSGRPFNTEKTARMSATFKETPNAEIVPVDGGFGVRESSNGQATVKQNLTDGTGTNEATNEKQDQESYLPKEKTLSTKKTTETPVNTGVDGGSVEGINYQTKSKEATKTEANQETPPANQINDFGEKIGGARKDEYKAYAEKLDNAGSMKSQPLSKSFPKPDIQKMLDDGADPRIVAFVYAIRENIPSKPRNEWKLNRWIKTAEQAREVANQLISGEIDIQLFYSKALENKGRDIESLELASVMTSAMLADDVPKTKEAIEALSGYKISENHYSMIVIDGVRHNNKTVYDVIVKGRSAGFGGLGNRNHYETFKEAYTAVVDAVTIAAATESETKGSDRKVKFEVYSNRYTKEIFIAKKAGKNIVSIKRGFESVKEARNYINNNYDELLSIFESKKMAAAVRRDENRSRVGDDYRDGENVTPELFSETFGFRGVEFGNWVEGGRRQQDLNDAYDALMDLSKIINVAPRAMSLNGSLGLAFGARGKGGKRSAAAHYERDKVAINLTKKNGAGSLAHEWFHAVDNYFGMMEKDNDNVKNPDFATEMDRQKMIYDNEIKKWRKSTGDDFAIRQEVFDAFKELESALTKEINMLERAKNADETRSKDYWSTVREITARSFERYVIGKLGADSYQNDYLANIIDQAEWADKLGESLDHYQYPLDNEMEVVNKAYDNLFNTIETKETENGNVAFFSKEQYSGSGKIKASDLQAEVDDFIQSLPGIDRYGLSIKILERPDQAFVKEAVAKSGAESASGAYLAEAKTMYLFNANINDKAKARRVLRHEILGHHGLNLFSVADKKAIFQAVTATRKNPAFKKDWEQVDSLYTELSDEQKAEEIIASIAEEQPGLAKRFLDAVVNKVIEILKKIGFIKKGEIIARSQLRGLVTAMADGISRGVPQQTFPKSGEQYSKQPNENNKTTINKVKSTSNQFQESAFTTLIDRFSEMRAGAREKALALLTNNQISEVFDSIFKKFERNPLEAFHREMQDFEGDIAYQLKGAEALKQKWDKLSFEDSKKLSEIMSESTFYRIDASEDMDIHTELDDLQIEKKRIGNRIGVLKKKALGRPGEAKQQMMAEIKELKDDYADISRKIEALPLRKTTHSILKNHLKAMPKEAQELYTELRDAYTRQFDEQVSELINRIKRNISDEQSQKNMISEIHEKFKRKGKHDIYFPLTRFGDHYVLAKKLDDNGEVKDYMRLHFETEKAAVRVTSELRSEGWNVTRSTKTNIGNAMADVPGFASKIIEMASEKKGALESLDSIKDDINQLMLQQMPEVSFLKRSIHRKYVKGYSADQKRAFAHTMFHGAYRIAKIRHGDRLKSYLDSIRDEVSNPDGSELIDEKNNAKAAAVYNEMILRYDDSMNPQGAQWSAMLTQFGFTYYLGGSLGSGLVNITQTPLFTAPYLGAKYGFGKATKELALALKDYGLTEDKKLSLYDSAISLERNTKIKSEERAMIKELVDTGVIENTQSHSLAQLSETNTMQQQSALRENAARTVGWFYHNAEVLNREVTALATYRLAKNKGSSHKAAVEMARKVIYDTHFDYSYHNRARIMRSNPAKVILMFKNYAQQATWLIARNAWKVAKGDKEALKFVAGSTLAHLAIAGSAGLPVWSLVGFVASKFLGDDDDWEQEYRKWFTEIAEAAGSDNPELAGEVVTRGLINAYVGIDVSNRTSADLREMWIRADDIGDRSPVHDLVVALTGPLGSFAFNTLDSAVNTFHNGDTWKGLNKMIPVKGLRDASMSLEMEANGLYSWSGDSIMGAEEVGFGDVARKFIGFTPSEASRRYERNGAIYEIDRRLKSKAKSLKAMAFKAHKNGNEERFNKIIEQIQEFNFRFPTYAIDLEASLRSRYRGAARADEKGLRIDKRNYPYVQKYDVYSDR